MSALYDTPRTLERRNEEYIMEINTSYERSSTPSESSVTVGKHTKKHQFQTVRCHFIVLYLIAILTVFCLAALCVCMSILYSIEYTNVKRKFSALQNITQNLSGSVNMLQHNAIGLTPDYPAESCASILHNAPASISGYYWLKFSANSPAIRGYCDMTRVCGGVRGGWMRVVNTDMKKENTTCPLGYHHHKLGEATIGCIIDSNAKSCRSSWISTMGFKSTKICGSVVGYQFGMLNGFNSQNSLVRKENASIDSNYVDGISLTYGQHPRKHIWTFVGGGCPCKRNRPAFLKDDFYCGRWKCQNNCTVDPRLWIGFGSCQSRQPGWFFKEISEPITSVEMRLCRDENREEEDIALQTMQLYVQ